MTPRRRAALSLLLVAAVATVALAQGRRRGPNEDPIREVNVVLGRPTDRSLAVSVLSPTAVEAFVEYGPGEGDLRGKTAVVRGAAREPFEIPIEALKPDTRYFYRLRHRAPASDQGGALRAFSIGPQGAFTTARAPGRSFTFGVQGDSHPEREGRMFEADLYRRTLDLVANERPDFYVMLGDDFSIERLIADGTLSQASVDAVYAGQRPFLSVLAGSTPLFLVNGNHEEAARFLLDGTPGNAAVLAGRARFRFFPLPAPDAFYSGDKEPIEHVGLPRDYYAWTWGDALFVVIDPYWHSKTLVDAPPGGQRGSGGGGRRPQGETRSEPERQGNAARAAGRNRDLWAITLGDAQYAWLRETLLGSRARYKFVFAHHVMGTGRGGVEVAGNYEWGGQDPRERTTFAKERPGWERPIHALMAKAGVTIFFQGHDHLFARQEKDGVIYQTVPNPADSTYTAFNREAYRSGDVLPNSGHLRVTVAPEAVRVDYVRSWRASDETDGRRHGEIAFSYRVPFTRP